MQARSRQRDKRDLPDGTWVIPVGRQMPPWVARGGLACLAWERAFAQWMHQATVRPSLLILFQAVSHLGDGLIWYAVFPCVAMWGGKQSTACLLRLAGMTALNLLVYKILKQMTGRPRPFVSCPGIRVCANVLDEYSFPSGHVLHAVAFTIVLSAYYPIVVWPLSVFAFLVACSRVVLGLHYPSDVLMGAAIGALSAWGTLNLF
ncbi:MAG: phosphatase PAP2 family protein [Acidobacteriota bacterium]